MRVGVRDVEVGGGVTCCYTGEAVEVDGKNFLQENTR